MKKDVNGTVTLFIYNQSGQLIAEANGSGVIQREYAYYQNRPIALLAYGTTADVYYYHADHLNTPQVITDQAQGIVWEGDYEPFGEVDITTNVVENNLRFPGQYYDAETGSYYNYFRDYEPSIGRYLESDPIGLMGGINTYTYVVNLPLRYIDPEGKNVLIIGGVVVAAVIIAASAQQSLNDSYRNDYEDGGDGYWGEFPNRIDPWNDTFTEERSPGWFPTPGPGDRCKERYDEEKKDCDNSCGNGFSKAACKAKAFAAYLFCSGQEPPDDGGPDYGPELPPGWY